MLFIHDNEIGCHLNSYQYRKYFIIIINIILSYIHISRPIATNNRHSIYNLRWYFSIFVWPWVHVFMCSCDNNLERKNINISFSFCFRFISIFSNKLTHILFILLLPLFWICLSRNIHKSIQKHFLRISWIFMMMLFLRFNSSNFWKASRIITCFSSMQLSWFIFWMLICYCLVRNCQITWDSKRLSSDFCAIKSKLQSI
jgi:hypothetical protein